MIDRNNREMLILIGNLYARPAEIHEILQVYFHRTGALPDLLFYKTLLEYSDYWITLKHVSYEAEKNENIKKTVDSYCRGIIWKLEPNTNSDYSSLINQPAITKPILKDTKAEEICKNVLYRLSDRPNEKFKAMGIFSSLGLNYSFDEIKSSINIMVGNGSLLKYEDPCSENEYKIAPSSLTNKGQKTNKKNMEKNSLTHGHTINAHTVIIGNKGDVAVGENINQSSSIKEAVKSKKRHLQLWG